jgi:proline racemase
MKRTTRLGWAEESRARAEAKRLHPEATIRQLRDLSWATRTPDGTYRGRFGRPLFTEQQWRDDSPAGRALEAATASLHGQAERKREPVFAHRVTVQFDVSDVESRAIASIIRGRKSKTLASDQELLSWARGELACSLLDLATEES